MTTISIDENIKLSKTHFSNLEELYLSIQEQLKFEYNLQLKAKKSLEISELELIDL